MENINIFIFIQNMDFMKIGKTLRKIIIAGTFALYGIGCSENNFNGKIGEEKIRF